MFFSCLNCWTSWWRTSCLHTSASQLSHSTDTTGIPCLYSSLSYPCLSFVLLSCLLLNFCALFLNECCYSRWTSRHSPLQVLPPGEFSGKISAPTLCVICSGTLLFSSRVLCPSLVTLCSHKSGRCAVELLPCASSLVPSVLHLSHGFQCSPTLNRQPYEGRLPLTS